MDAQLTHVPEEVQAFADTVKGGIPLKWHEYDDHWVIIMSDGRKMHFQKAQSPKGAAQRKKERKADQDAG